LFSTNRRAIKLKTWRGAGAADQFAFLVFYWTFGQQLFFRAGNAVNKLLAYALKDLFLCLANWGSSIPRSVSSSLSGSSDDYFHRLAFCTLDYLGVMQVIIRGAAWVMQRVMARAAPNL